MVLQQVAYVNVVKMKGILIKVIYGGMNLIIKK